MKLIIDIPEVDYMRIIKYQNVGGCGNMLTNAIGHGTPLDSVIEGIKKEIDECYRQADDIAYAEGLEMAELIIDEHIGKEK